MFRPLLIKELDVQVLLSNLMELLLRSQVMLTEVMLLTTMNIIIIITSIRAKASTLSSRSPLNMILITNYPRRKCFLKDYLNGSMEDGQLIRRTFSITMFPISTLLITGSKTIHCNISIQIEYLM